jgi:hypothetical protein
MAINIAKGELENLIEEKSKISRIVEIRYRNG